MDGLEGHWTENRAQPSPLAPTQLDDSWQLSSGYMHTIDQEKGTIEEEMVGWHHRLNGHGFGWTPGVGDGQGGLPCCGS